MKRRDMLAIGAAALTLPVTGTAALSEPESQIMVLYRRYCAITEAARAHPSENDAELDALFYDERDMIEDQLARIPAVSAQDMAAKMLVAHCHGDFTCLDYHNDPIWVETRALVCA